jgi:hypothetical protein
LHPPACSEKSSPTESGSPLGSPLRITQLNTYETQSNGYYGVVNKVIVHTVVSGKVGPLYIRCGAWRALLLATGGHPPYSFGGSNLPAGMQVFTESAHVFGNVTWTAPCSVAGQTFNVTFTVSDSRGAQSTPVTASLVVQTNGT